MVELKIQRFDGIEAIDFDRNATRLSVDTWSVDSLDLWDLRGELAAGEGGDLGYLPQVFRKRLQGAVDQEIKKSEGWIRATHFNNICVKSSENKKLFSYGVTAVRYPCDEKGDHLSIDLRFEDGTVIVCPAKCHILWASDTFVANHLNEISFLGMAWLRYDDGFRWTKD